MRSRPGVLKRAVRLKENPGAVEKTRLGVHGLWSLFGVWIRFCGTWSLESPSDQLKMVGHCPKWWLVMDLFFIRVRRRLQVRS